MTTSRLPTVLLLVLLLAACIVLSSCGGGGSSSSDSDASTTTVDPASVRVFSSQELCGLLPAAKVAQVTGQQVPLGVPVTGKIPACAYAVADGSTRRRIDVAVQPPLVNLGRSAGRAGYDHLVQVFVKRSPAATREEVPAVGDAATWFSLRSATLLIAYARDQVVTVQAAAGLTQEQAAALANEMLRAVASAPPPSTTTTSAAASTTSAAP